MFRQGLSRFLPHQGSSSYVPLRCINLHEYQSKELLSSNSVRVQRFKMADSPQQALEVASKLKFREFVVKAQILAGGRGKGKFSSGLMGGVKLTKDPAEVQTFVSGMIGHHLVTKQTSSSGVLVRKVMIADALDIERETYLAIIMDREYNGPVIIASPVGGVDIEDVAEKSPEKIFMEPVDIFYGLSQEQALRIASNLGFREALANDAAEQIIRLYNLFVSVDATQVEINPFGEALYRREEKPHGCPASNAVHTVEEKSVVSFDAKINFDDNARFRQLHIFEQEDHTESDSTEVEAASYGMSYVRLDGNIACIVNGAGLAMATCDIIKLHGGEPANFLDLGGGVQADGVCRALTLVSQDPQVKAVLTNIFGGIVDCSVIAQGVIKAYQTAGVNIPVVIRLLGTNVELAHSLLKQSALPIHLVDDLSSAAKLAVHCSLK